MKHPYEMHELPHHRWHGPKEPEFEPTHREIVDKLEQIEETLKRLESKF